MTEWTDEQQAAIDSIDRETVVAAAAGSGKTAVLIERTIKMLADPELGITADRLLAVTFTNDAANQMKEKLSAAMDKLLEKEPENAWIAKQQESLPLAGVCTIDSFCMDLVRSNINEFEFSGSFTAIDQEENRILTEKALEEAAEYYYENLPEKMKLLSANFSEEDDSEILEYAARLIRFKGSLPFPEQWKKQTYRKMSTVVCKYNNAWLKKAETYAKLAISYAESMLSYAEDVGAYDKYKETYRVYQGTADKVLEYVQTGRAFDMSAELASATKFKTPSRPNRKKVSDWENEIYDKINFCKAKVKACLEDIREIRFCSEEEAQLQQKQICNIFDVLWEFAGKAEEILYGYKLEKNKVYFSDVTKMTISLLARETEDGFERTELAKKIVEEQRYKIILIDEFQDVNNLQDVIFKCISDTDDLSILGKNVFVVGDIKQSIYRFRQSNPAVFERAINLAAKEEYSDRAFPVILSQNFRSRKCVIDFVNFVFDKVMSTEIGEVDYNSKEALAVGAKFPDSDPLTEIMLIDCNSDSDDDIEEDGNSSDPECGAVASEIKSMLANKTTVFDKELNGLRPCRPGDFCVLLRTGKKAAAYIKAFEQVGINAVTDSIKGYLGAREVSLALSMLKVIDNPMQDIHFAAVCLSPVFDFTPDEMAQLRLVDKNRKLYQIFLAASRDESSKEYGYEPVDIGNEELSQKCAETIKTVSMLRFCAAGMSLEKLIRKVYDTKDFMSVAAAYENSQQKRANLRMLVRYAADFESSSGGNLGDFLRYLDRVSESGNDFDEALTVAAGSDTVLVKTIHKSKGLEYPFVIVGDMARQYNISPQKDKLFLNEQAGIGMTLRDRLPKCNRHTVFYDYVYETDKNEQLSEELRILYVALTRAREKLILPLCFKKMGKNRLMKAVQALSERGEASWEDVAQFLSYSEIIGYALLFHPDKQKFCEYLGVDDKELPAADTQSEIYFSNKKYDKSENVSENSFVPKPVDIKLFGTITANIGSSDEENEERTVSKLSVTEFIRELEKGSFEKDITYFPPIPEFDPDRKPKATAAEKGTDTHLFMELADFEAASKDANAELERLVTLNKMTRLQADNVDIKTVESFFESDIYKLCEQSGSYMRERKFMAKLSDMRLEDPAFADYKGKDIMLQGIADLIIETESGYVIVDYKTDNVTAAETLVERHREQLLLYKAAFDIILDKKIESCYIYSFKLREAVKMDFDNLQKIHKKP